MGIDKKYMVCRNANGEWKRVCAQMMNVKDNGALVEEENIC